jgi:hypothetical protein
VISEARLTAFLADCFAALLAATRCTTGLTVACLTPFSTKTETTEDAPA